MYFKNEKNKAYPRRKFLKNFSIGTLSLLGGNIFPRLIKATPTTYPPRTRIPNPYLSNEGKPLLVSVVGTDFKQMLTAGLEKIGGLGKLIDNNQDVLIKPNLNAVDVYPAISSTESIVSLTGEVVAATTGNVRIGDVSYHPTDSVYQHADLANALAGSGAELIHFTEKYNVRRSGWSSSKPDYLVYSEVYNAPIIINFACSKRHFLAKMSTALKNNVGCVAASGASQSRQYLHGLSGTAFLKEIAEIAGLINPELTIVDARSMLIGNGPFSSSPGAKILEGINFLIISGDMNAVDHYCSMLLQGFDSTFFESQIAATLNQAHSLGLGVKDLNDVKIIECTTNVKDSHNNLIPQKSELDQNYPNPFNATTRIKFKLNENGNVKLNIYNARGQRISTLINKEMLPGEYSVNFNAHHLPGGAYFCQLRAGDNLQMKKMILIK